MSDLICKRSGGKNIVARPQSRARWYPAATTDAAQVAVYWRFVDEHPSSNRLIGLFGRGEVGTLPYNPDSDRDIILSTISYSASGTPDVIDHADAVQATLIFRREVNAPVIVQSGASRADQITLVASGVTKFARRRRVRIADNSSMTDSIELIEDRGAERLPDVFYIERTLAGGGTHATGAIVFSANPAATETVTIGARVYTFSASDNSFDSVLIGANLAATLINLRDHVNSDGVATAVSNGSTTITLTAIATGTAGNSIALSETSAVGSVTAFAGGAGGDLAQTIYVRVSHSSGGAYGAESPVLALSFADSNNTGGTSGTGDPFNGQKFSADDL